MLIASWRRLGNQSTQVTFTALFVLLLGGHQPLHYLTHRVSEAAIGVITGLVINIAVFPPLQLRPAEHAVRQWGNGIADALDFLADAVAAPGEGGESGERWPQYDDRLFSSAQQAHETARNARESLRWNPRATASRRVPRPDSATLGALEELTTRTRAVARYLIDTTTEHTQPQLPASFGEQYASLLHMIADAVRQLADQREHTPSGEELAALSDCQHQVEHQAAYLADRGGRHIAAQRLTRLSAEMIREIGRP
jgi:uncharacterized membrane protein YccC